ncbi:MAG: D-amino acid oxidase family protein [Caulobacteraceae bacterium]|nr:D-amino acid oxidase family protein [Caulobacteraceae bacterium]
MAGDLTLVAGGGALGLAIALELAARGRAVALCDPAALGDNASGVAAGMLAPAMEAALDPPSAGHFSLLLAARDAWPDFAAGLALPIERNGAALVGAPGFVAGVRTALARLGEPARDLDRAALAGLAPGAADGLFTPLDWRIDPIAALSALRRAAQAAGVRLIGQSVTAFEPGHAQLSRGEPLKASHLVIATGASRGLAALAPELAALSPIKGQILHLPEARPPACVLRGEGVYVCPSAQGVVIGATMEAGREDRMIDPAAIEALRHRAAALDPALAQGPGAPRAGVRGATPDGLPLVGMSRTPGVWIAAGARRNGWLLAPLVAKVLVARMLGEAAPALSGALKARRFDQ